MSQDLRYALIEPVAELIGGGAFLAEMNRALRVVCNDLVSYHLQAPHDEKAKGGIDAKITIKPVKDAAGEFEITYRVKSTTPARGSVTHGKASAEGQMRFQLGDLAEGRINQQLTLFDEDGKVIGQLDRGTGEVIE